MLRISRTETWLWGVAQNKMDLKRPNPHLIIKKKKKKRVQKREVKKMKAVQGVRCSAPGVMQPTTCWYSAVSGSFSYTKFKLDRCHT